MFIAQTARSVGSHHGSWDDNDTHSNFPQVMDTFIEKCFDNIPDTFIPQNKPLELKIEGMPPVLLSANHPLEPWDHFSILMPGKHMVFSCMLAKVLSYYFLNCCHLNVIMASHQLFSLYFFDQHLKHLYLLKNPLLFWNHSPNDKESRPHFFFHCLAKCLVSFPLSRGIHQMSLSVSEDNQCWPTGDETGTRLLQASPLQTLGIHNLIHRRRRTPGSCRYWLLWPGGLSEGTDTNQDRKKATEAHGGLKRDSDETKLKETKNKANV